MTRPQEIGTPESAVLEPVGVFRCRETWPYDVPRQASLAGGNPGEIRLEPGRGFEQALTGLEGFSHIWIVYLFHHNRHWKPMVQPPRGEQGKVGVFATRAPYRPNPVGLSCVELVAVRGLSVWVRGHDLLDGTPVLDIKPYLPYSDSVPTARTGWVEHAAVAESAVSFVPEAAAQLAWLAENGGPWLEEFLRQQLRERPGDGRRKRVRPLADGLWEIAYRTWRAEFAIAAGGAAVTVRRIYSGYTPGDLAPGAADKYADKALHRAFVVLFS
jgi:tRNA-Thr(GGU) m(6)t(6)A37 methyltransferase TsaA